MGGECPAEELISLVGQIDLNASAVARHRFAPYEPLGSQSIEHTGQRPFGHERCGGELRAGHPFRVAEGGDNVELRRSQTKQPDMPAVRAAECQVGLNQRTQHLEDGVVFEIGQFHVERAA